jgi:nucleoid DNA-binding protein
MPVRDLVFASYLLLDPWRGCRYEDRANPHSLMSNLTKRDMVVKISDEVGITQQQTFAVIQKTLEHITDSLAEGNNVELRNFGVFEVRLTKSRVGRNPNKPETDVVIPARATVKFKPGKIMRQRVLLRTEELSKSGAA